MASSTRVIQVPPKSWSPSIYLDWDGCPRKYRHKKVDKIKVGGKIIPAYPEVKSRAMERGTMIHAKAEEFLLGNIRGMPDELARFEREFKSLKKAGAAAEVKWAFREDGSMLPDFFDKRAWLRTVLDAEAHLSDDVVVVDFKTGRPRGYYEVQMEIYSWAVTMARPHAKNIITELWFLDHPKEAGKNPVTKEATAREAVKFGDKWREKSRKMLTDRRYEARPGPACDYCPFRTDKELANGQPGPCDHWRHA